MYRAHQSVQTNAIMVHVIHAIARRYAHIHITRTNKYTIKKNQFSLSNSHLLVRSSRVEVDLRYLAPFLWKSQSVFFFCFAFSFSSSLFICLFVCFTFCLCRCKSRFFFLATTYFIHCMHLCLERECVCVCFKLFFFSLLRRWNHSHLISKWKLIIRNDFILFLFHSPNRKFHIYICI